MMKCVLADEGYDSGIGDSLPDGTDDNQSISDKEDSLNWLRVFIDNTPCRQHLRLNSQGKYKYIKLPCFLII